MPEASSRLAGHGLPNEGRIFVYPRMQSKVMGAAVCECGEKSDPLPNAAQRKAWHRRHKTEVRRRTQARP